MANNSNRKAIEFMVQGALPPHSTNVLWMDTSNPELPIIKTFNAGAWVSVLSSNDKAVEILSKVVLDLTQEVDRLSDEIKDKMAKDATVAKEAQATLNKEAILTAIPSVQSIQSGLAKTTDLPTDYARAGNGTNVTNTDIKNTLTDSTDGLAAIKTQAANAASDAAAAKTAALGITGYATEANATTNKNAIIAEIQANAGIPTLTIPSTTASQELAPNTLYVFAERTINLTLTLGTPITGIANEYHCFIVVGSTAPTITWPTGIVWNGGNAPTIEADKTYEVSILNNVAAFFEV